MKTKYFSELLISARKKKRLTQNDVCRLIGIGDISTLSNWENGKILPNLDAVISLTRLYEDSRIFKDFIAIEKGADDLMPEYLQEHRPLDDDLRICAVNIQKEYNDVSQEMPKLINILWDGEIDDNELNDYENFIIQAKELIQVLVPLISKYEMKNKKPLQDCRLERAFA